MRDLEHQLQKACIRWFRVAFPRKTIFAVPNGGQRNFKVAAKLKREGVMAGVSDLILLHDKTTYFIEMKTDKGKQSEYQEEFQKQVEAEGMSYHICRSLEEFKQTIQNIFKL